MESETRTQDAAQRLKHELQLQRRTGIKVRLEFDDAQWWTVALIEYIESIATPKQVNAAKNYVKSGHVLEMNVFPGLVEAKVQGRRKSPYHVRLYVPLPTEGQLAEIKRRLSERAIFGALLLSGEMPKELNEIFLASGVALMPGDYVRSQLLCSCPEPESVCKHILAVLYIVAGVFDRDPFLLLRMRGLEKDDLLASLTAPRGPCPTSFPGSSGGMCAAGASEPQMDVPFFCETAPAADPLPLDPTFYGGQDLPEDLSRLLDESQDTGDIAGAHALLFDFPLWRGETSFRDSLSPYYESVAKLLRGK